jgi:tetratricopeptide (TPR) repeat protein
MRPPRSSSAREGDLAADDVNLCSMMRQYAMVGSTISDIASLWILVLVVAATFILWLFRRELRQAIHEGRLRFRHRQTEIDTGARPLAELQGGPSAVAEPAEDTPREDQDRAEDKAVAGTADTAVTEAKPSLGAVFEKVREGDAAAARETFEALQAQEADATQRMMNEATFAAARAMWGGDSGALRELEQLSQRKEIAAVAHRLRGSVLAHAGVHDAALAAYEASAAVAEDDRDKAFAATGAANALEDLGRRADAVARVEATLSLLTDDQAKANLYETLAEIFKADKDWQSRAAALEAVVVVRPTDPDLRFRVGYSYAQADRQDMALLHYDAALVMQQDAWTQNNIGVAYEHLNMPIKSVSSYQTAWENGNTLAAANLALKLMDAGFAERASTLLSEASQRPEANPKVAQRTAQLAELNEAEAERKSEALGQARQHSLFFREFATAKWASRELEPDDINGGWSFEDGAEAAASAIGADRRVTITWTQSDTSMQVVGTIHNHAFELTHEALERPIVGERRWTRKGNALGYYSERDEEIALLLLTPAPGKLLKLVRPTKGVS